MKLNEIEKALQEALTGDSLTLSTATCRSPAVDGLLAKVDRPYGLILTGVKLGVDQDTLVLAGSGSLLGTEAAIRAVFASSGETVTVHIVAALPDAWRFSDSFPDLPGYIDFTPGQSSNNPHPSFFNDLVLDQAFFILAEVPVSLEEHAVTAPTGLSFAARVRPDGPLSHLNSLLSVESLVLNGAINLDGDLSAIDLSAAVLPGPAVGPIQFEDVCIRLHSAVRTDADGTQPHIELSAGLRLGAQASITLAGQLLIGHEGPIEITAYGDGLSLPGIGDLAALIGGDEMLRELPSALQNAQGIQIDKAAVTLDLQQVALERVELDLAASGSWALWPGVLELQTFEARLKVVKPFDKIQRRMNVSISSDTEVLGLGMALLIELPALTVRGGPQKIKKIKLAAVTSKMLPAALPLPKSLVVSKFGLSSDIRQHRMSLDMALEGEWPIKLGASSIRVRELGLAVEIQGQTLGRSTAAVSGVADFAGGDIRVFAQLSAGGDWDLSVQLPPLNLAALIEAAAGKLGLLADLPPLTIADGYISSSSVQGKFEISGRCLEDWEIVLGAATFNISDLALSMAYLAGPKQATGQISGTLQLDDTTVGVTVEMGDALVVAGTIPHISLSRLAENFFDEIGLPADLPDLALSDTALTITPHTGEFSLAAESANSWRISLGAAGLEMRNLHVAVQRTAVGKGKMATTGRIEGLVTIAGLEVSLAYNFPGDFVLAARLPTLPLSPLLQDLCGSEILRDVPIPSNLLDLKLSEITLVAAPQAGTFALAGRSRFGQTEFLVKRIKGGKWGFCVGFLPSPSWKFSEISPELKMLDSLNLSNTALILSSARERDLALENIRVPREDMEVVPGLNIFADIDLRGLGADQVLGIEQLTVYAALGAKPADLALEASLEADIALGSGVVFGDVRLRLRPAPPNFSLALLGSITALLDNREMHFTGAMQVAPRSATFAGTMEGLWRNPFEAKGIAVADMALEMGLGFAPLLPTLGIAGSLQIGNFQGRAAVKFDAAMPSRSMLAVEFNRLYLMDIIGAFCAPALVGAIPRQIAATVLDIGYEDVKIYIVPQETRIGEMVFEQGITLQGTMIFWGLRAFGYMNIDYVQGIVVRAEVDPIDLGVLKIQGAGKKTKASLYLEVKPRQVPVIDIAGAVELLGIRAETQLQLSESGFFFTVAGSLFGGMFAAVLEVSGSRFQQGGNFYVKAAMKNDLFAYLRREATAAIQQATSGAVASLSRAQQDISAKQQEVNKLFNEVERLRATVRAERERDRRRLKEAQRAVSNAQAEVNKIQGEINKAKNTINYHKGRIAAKRRWYNKSKWYQKSYRWAEYAAEASWRGAAITGLYTAIGTLEAAKWTAIGILEAAKLTLRGLEEATKLPIDADPRILGALALWGTATAALETAKGFLEGVKLTLGAMGEVAQFIVDAGLGGVLDIRAAYFEGRLDTIDGGQVAMAVTLSFMGGKPKTLTLAFDFGSPARAALSLANALLPGGR